MFAGSLVERTLGKKDAGIAAALAAWRRNDMHASAVWSPHRRRLYAHLPRPRQQLALRRLTICEVWPCDVVALQGSGAERAVEPNPRGQARQGSIAFDQARRVFPLLRVTPLPTPRSRAMSP
jgi:hypothetical protein